MADPNNNRPARQRRLEGWSAFTQQQRQSSSSSSSGGQPFPSLDCHGAPQPRISGQAQPGFASSFAEVVKKSLEYEGFQRAQQEKPALIVARLSALYNWADKSLIEDVLEALDMDEEGASAYLLSLSNENQSTSTESIDFGIVPSEENGCTTSTVDLRNDYNFCNPSQGEFAELRDNSKDRQGEFKGNCLAPYILETLPIEPEWEQDDIYHGSRRDALKMSRAREKHSLGAFKAFMKGDFTRAKLLSRKAQEERVEAEMLHAEAAKQIFHSRNSDGQKDLWELDLHGLHAGEAIVVLQQRLSNIEEALTNSHDGGDINNTTSSRERPGSNSQHILRVDQEGMSYAASECFKSVNSGSQQTKYDLQLLQGRLAGRLPFQRELRVVTGVGVHSHGGASLPRAIKNFLLQKGYKFDETRSGMISVHPKFHLVKKEHQPSLLDSLH